MKPSSKAFWGISLTKPIVNIKNKQILKDIVEKLPSSINSYQPPYYCYLSSLQTCSECYFTFKIFRTQSEVIKRRHKMKKNIKTDGWICFLISTFLTIPKIKCAMKVQCSLLARSTKNAARVCDWTRCWGRLCLAIPNCHVITSCRVLTLAKHSVEINCVDLF